MDFPRQNAQDLICIGLDEDLGEKGDLTTKAVVPPGTTMTAHFVSREPAVCAGLPVARLVTEELARRGFGGAEVTEELQDGQRVVPGDVLASCTGDAHNLLVGERLILNLMARLSGIATLTAAAVEEVAGTGCKIVDTRKTTPGLRRLEKYAVRAGGGENHRETLDELVMIKDNHKQLGGGLKVVLTRARDAGLDLSKIEVEVDSLDELKVVLEFGCGWILLDNMSAQTVQEAVALVDGRASLEASGGMTPGRLRAYAEAGVDRISIGRLTHSARSIDIGLDIAPTDKV